MLLLMLSERAQRIAYLEKLVGVRKIEEERLIGIISSNASPSRKLQARGYLALLMRQVQTEMAELDATKAQVLREPPDRFPPRGDRFIANRRAS